MSERKLGIVVIGQSPRTDVVPEMKKTAGIESEVLECGALDGLSMPEIKKMAPAEGEYYLVTALKDGTEVKLSRDKLVPRIQGCVDTLDERGAGVILLLCLGEWPQFKSDRLVVRALEPFSAFALALVDRGDSIGVILPAESQVEDARKRWRKGGVKAEIVAVSPYTANAKNEIRRAAGTLKEKNVKVVVMACPGFTVEMEDIVRKATGKPVVLVRSALAWMVKELVD